MKGVGEFPPPPRPPRRLSLPPSFLLPAAVFLTACRRGVCVVLSSLKNGVFLKGLFCRKAANAAKLLTYAALAAWVRQTGR